MNRFLKLALALSITANVLFYYRDFCDKPDYDFYGGSRKNAYLIKRRLSGGSYVIQHREMGNNTLHLYTARCKSSLTWLKGVANPAESMGDSCTYVPSMVGKTVVEGMMRVEGSTIVLTPWANADTVQTADVLTIESDDVVK